MAQALLKVLVVEDDDLDYLTTRRLLRGIEAWRCALSRAEGLEQALKLLRSERYDLCLCDQYLGLDRGTELIRRMQQEGIPTPTLLITAANSRSVEVAAAASGAWGLLRKDELSSQAIERAARFALEHQERHDSLQSEARIDSLTGLLNRRALREEIQSALRRYREEPGHELTLLYLDLDRFKPINDSYGHDVGDRVLERIAGRLREALHPELDRAARVGGDEFALLVQGPQAIRRSEELAERLLRRIREPIPLHEERKLQVSASIGLCRADEAIQETDELIRRADGAMYQAKARGVGMLHHHRDVAGRSAPPTSLHLRPIVQLSTDRVVGLRLAGPPPSDDQRASARLRDAVRLWAEARRPDQRNPPPLHLPMGRSLLMRRQSAAELISACEDATIDPSALVIELDIRRVRALDASRAIEALMERGLSLCLDQAEQLRMSLLQLESLRVDSLRLGPGFTRLMGERPVRERSLRLMVQVAHSQDLHLVLGGVSSPEQLALATRCGVRRADGPLFDAQIPAP